MFVLMRKRLALHPTALLVWLCACGATRPPCVPSGAHEVFARLSSAGLAGGDGGVASCAVELGGTLDFRSETTAHFALDGGFVGDCSLSVTDYRDQSPGYCLVGFSCGAAFATARTRPSDGLVEGTSLSDRTSSCDYAWAATQVPR